MGKIIIQKETTTDPISLIGREAGVCWGADITDKEKNLSNLKSVCNNEKNLEVYSNLTSEDYIFDPFFCFDDTLEGKHFRSVNLIEDYLYYDNYQELDNYKEFMEYYNFDKLIVSDRDSLEGFLDYKLKLYI